MANHLCALMAVLPRCVPQCRLTLLSAWCISRPRIQQTPVNATEPWVLHRMFLHRRDHAGCLKPFQHYEAGQYLCHPEGRQAPQQAKALENLREELAGTSSSCGTCPTLPALHAVSSGGPMNSEIPWPLFQGLPVPGKCPLLCTVDAWFLPPVVPSSSHVYSFILSGKSVRWKASPRIN